MLEMQLSSSWIADSYRCLSLSVVGMVSKPMPESTPEFTIQQEDFPALPGAQSKYIYCKQAFLVWPQPASLLFEAGICLSKTSSG